MNVEKLSFLFVYIHICVCIFSRKRPFQRIVVFVCNRGLLPYFLSFNLSHVVPPPDVHTFSSTQNIKDKKITKKLSFPLWERYFGDILMTDVIELTYSLFLYIIFVVRFSTLWLNYIFYIEDEITKVPTPDQYVPNISLYPFFSYNYNINK